MIYLVRREYSHISTFCEFHPFFFFVLLTSLYSTVHIHAKNTQLKLSRRMWIVWLLFCSRAFNSAMHTNRPLWLSPRLVQQHNQIDYILVRMRFRSGMNSARKRSFPGADIGSDHELLMMTFRLRLKRISEPKHTRLKFDLEKLEDPNVLQTFQAMIGGKFAPPTIMNSEDRHRYNDHCL